MDYWGGGGGGPKGMLPPPPLKSFGGPAPPPPLFLRLWPSSLKLHAEQPCSAKVAVILIPLLTRLLICQVKKVLTKDSKTLI